MKAAERKIKKPGHTLKNLCKTYSCARAPPHFVSELLRASARTLLRQEPQRDRFRLCFLFAFDVRIPPKHKYTNTANTNTQTHLYPPSREKAARSALYCRMYLAKQRAFQLLSLLDRTLVNVHCKCFCMLIGFQTRRAGVLSHAVLSHAIAAMACDRSAASPSSPSFFAARFSRAFSPKSLSSSPRRSSPHPSRPHDFLVLVVGG